jgi:hypothetical protein
MVMIIHNAAVSQSEFWIQLIMAPKSVYSKVANFCAFYGGTFLLKSVSEKRKRISRLFMAILPSMQISVADPGCLSRIPDPDFYPSRILDPGSRISDRKTATREG